ncbi:MAG TPA: HD domain-containing protein [Candidatus Xenobia bacterium]|jgi:uncharacterized protein
MLRVYQWSLRLAEEAGADLELAGAAALVHDLAKVPKNHPDRSIAGQQSAVLAVRELETAGYTAVEIDTIVKAVAGSNWSAGQSAETALGAVLQDADRLDALGAIGIARTFACAQAMGGGEFYHPEDPLGQTERALDDRRWAVDHFKVKLLRLSEGMHFEGSRSEAARRHQFMVAFLEELAREL